MANDRVNSQSRQAVFQVRVSFFFPKRVRGLSLKWPITASWLLAATCVPAFAQSMPSFLATAAQIESDGNTTATNANSTSTGMYQDTQAALAEAGVLTINSQPTSSDFGSNANWSNVTFTKNQWGITSQQQLLSASPEVQTQIEQAYLTSTWNQEQGLGLSNYIGQTVNGQQINQSALLGCGELLGASGCQQYLATGQASSPELTATAEADISQYSQSDSSAITGEATTQVAQSQPSVGAGGENTAGYTMYCNSAASTVVNEIAQQAVQASVNLAADPQTGYSLVNGSSILSPLSGGYAEFSCLDNLFNQGLNVLFSPPNLSGILNSLVNAACTKAETAIQGVLQPLNQNFYDATNVGGFSALGAGLSIGTSNSGTISSSVNGIGTGLSPSALSTQILGQAIGPDFATPATFGNAY